MQYWHHVVLSSATNTVHKEILTTVVSISRESGSIDYLLKGEWDTWSYFNFNFLCF